MKTLFTEQQFTNAVEQSQKLSNVVSNKRENNSTLLNSTIFSKDKCTESAQCDFIIITALSQVCAVHIDSLVAIANQCNLLQDCSKSARARIHDHVYKSIERKKLAMSYDRTSRILTIDDEQQQVYADCVLSDSYQSQIFEHASRLHSLLFEEQAQNEAYQIEADMCFDIATVENRNFDHVVALRMNKKNKRSAKK